MSERGSVDDQKRLFWRVKEPLSEPSVTKMWVNVWLFQFIPLQPIDNQHFAKPVKDVGFLYENSRRQENAESIILFRPLDYDVGCQSL